MNEHQYYVQAILDREIIVYCTLKNKFNFLKQLGAKGNWFWKKTWTIKNDSIETMLSVITQLNTSGVAFSFDEHGWGPSSIFTYYRDNKLICGEFKEIFWIEEGIFKVEIK
jgi:hypothetical protein